MHAAVACLCVMLSVSDTSSPGTSRRMPVCDVHERTWCRYVICMEHDLQLLPHVNVSSSRISLLIAKCASVCDLWASVRGQRSSMVLNQTLGAMNSGRPLQHLLTQHTGGWMFGASGANIPHYFTSQGAGGSLAPLVRPTELLTCLRRTRARRLRPVSPGCSFHLVCDPERRTTAAHHVCGGRPHVR